MNLCLNKACSSKIDQYGMAGFREPHTGQKRH